MIYLQVFISMVLFFIVVFLCIIAIGKFADWIGNKWGSEAALISYVSIYIPFTITLFTWLLGGGQ